MVVRIRNGKYDLFVAPYPRLLELEKGNSMTKKLAPLFFIAVFGAIIASAAEINLAPAQTTIAACAAPAPPQPTLIRDAVKAASKWQQKRAAQRVKAGRPEKADLDLFTIGERITPTDVVLVGDMRKFFKCLGAGNDLAEQSARNQRYVTMGVNDPILINYDQEMIGLIADYERSWVPGQSFTAGDSPRYLRDVVSSWILAASDLRAGKPLSVALQTEYLYLRKVGIKPTDPNLRLLARRIAETAKVEWMGSQKPIRVNIASAVTLTATR